jgi:hypothetical protein
MKAILLQRHEKFCKSIDKEKAISAHEKEQLIIMEQELRVIFNKYQKSLNNVREVILEYERKELLIKQVIKRLMRDERRKIVKMFSKTKNETIQNLRIG